MGDVTWRVDRLEVLWGMRLLKSNLVSLFIHHRTPTGPSDTMSMLQTARLRSLIVDLAPPRFWDEAQPGWPIRNCNLNALAGLLARCGSPEEVRHGLMKQQRATGTVDLPQ